MTGSADVSTCWQSSSGSRRQDSLQLLERAPQPAGPPVGLALARQHRKQVAPVPADLGQEPGLAAPAQQVPDHGDGQQLGSMNAR